MTLFWTTKSSCIPRQHQSSDLPFICFEGDSEFDTQISNGALPLRAGCVFHGEIEINPDGKREPVPKARIYYEGTLGGILKFCFSQTEIDDGLIELNIGDD